MDEYPKQDGHSLSSYRPEKPDRNLKTGLHIKKSKFYSADYHLLKQIYSFHAGHLPHKAPCPCILPWPGKGLLGIVIWGALVSGKEARSVFL